MSKKSKHFDLALYAVRELTEIIGDDEQNKRVKGLAGELESTLGEKVAPKDCTFDIKVQ